MKRGEVWTVELDPTLGHEQAGRRPALLLSVDEFNDSPADLVTLLPITSKPRQLLTRIPITPPEGGLRFPSWVICEQSAHRVQAATRLVLRANYAGDARRRHRYRRSLARLSVDAAMGARLQPR